MKSPSRFALCFFTTGGETLARRLTNVLRDQFPGVGAQGTLASQPIITIFDKNTQNLRAWFQQEFASADALLCIGATGIAVRMLNGLMRGKDHDPAVIVLDEQGRYVIPLLSGHLGGANRLAVMLAGQLGAQAVITTATDLNNVFAVDEWAIRHDCTIMEPALIKHVSAALLKGESVGFHSDFPVMGQLPGGLVPEGESNITVCVSLDGAKGVPHRTLHVIPHIAILGAGCRKGVQAEVFESAALDMLAANGVSVKALRTLASLDIKRDEPCLQAFADKYGLDFRTFCPEELREVSGRFTASPFVLERTGVDNVCERAAMAAGGKQILVPKTSGKGIALALGVMDWTCAFD